ncbi:MAG TPA: hypothetical protein VLS49_01715 [Usitatibacter sp.]|nr:hypothetical protein [Usitatibacter sp.]
MATDLDRLVHIVRDYLASWRPDQLQLLPLEVAATALASSADIPPRAVLAAQAELEAKSDDERHELLREMALTLSAAATRMRVLATIRGAEGLHESGSDE